MILKDCIEIKTPPEKVYEWLVQRFESNKNYQAWHTDHVSVRWVKGNSAQEGAVLYAEEYIHGKLHKLTFLITRIEPNRRIEYRLFFPTSLFIPRNAFIIKPKGKAGSVFTAISIIRGGFLLRNLFRKRIQALRQHMKQEGESIKAALEAGSNLKTS